jgi:GNAT superfamily N-acetyltransferase
MLKERLEFLSGPGGLRAAVYFGLKLLARVETFHIVWTNARQATVLRLPPGWRYLSFYTTESLTSFSSGIIEQAAGRCAVNPQQLLSRGGSLHLLLISNSLAAQLTIMQGPSCRTDSPPLHLTMDETDAFLGYLYTWPAFRRQGAARQLIAATVSSLSTYNVQRIFAHVRATNVPSVAAFERAGWKTGGMLLCTLNGGLLLAAGTARVGLSFRSGR